MFMGSSIAGGRGIILGGAKPVPVDPRNYRHLRRGDIIVSLACVATNFLIGIACAVLIVLTGLLARTVPALETTLGILQAMFVYGIWLNAGLIAFNLLPIPPLDGSHVAKYLMPPALALRYVQLGRYGLLVLILLLSFAKPVLSLWMRPAVAAAERTLELVHLYLLPTAVQWLR
jgi:Zn-dependent protease